MYRPGTAQYDYHVSHFGSPPKFGYKDFIPMVTGSRFDADEWTELFADSGAKFAGLAALRTILTGEANTRKTACWTNPARRIGYAQDKPSKHFPDSWLAKTKEVIDGYSPDLMRFDSGLRSMPENYIMHYLAYYYSAAEENGQRPFDVRAEDKAVQLRLRIQNRTGKRDLKKY